MLGKQKVHSLPDLNLMWMWMTVDVYIGSLSMKLILVFKILIILILTDFFSLKFLLPEIGQEKK